jgi:hypothetical protein
MVRRKDEQRPNLPGGPAAERLKQFENARGLPATAPPPGAEHEPPDAGPEREQKEDEA